MSSPLKKTTASKGQAWFCTTGLPSDIAIDVDDMTFHLHKFPLMSRSKKLHELITEQEMNPGREEDDTEELDEIEEEEEEVKSRITLPEFPGGSETFEAAAKFCYGVKIPLSSSNVAALRCAGEFLEMTEDYSEGNLISKTEQFLSHTVLKSIDESVKTLKSCEKLIPLAETLGIIGRCVGSISEKASAADPALFGWPVKSGAETTARRKPIWLEELTNLSLPLFKRLISAMESTDLSREIIENCLLYYAKGYIPGITRSDRKPPSEDEQRELLETVIVFLPSKPTSNSAARTKCLFKLLKTANILKVSGECRSAFERRIGFQLEQASLDDLLMPSYCYTNETLYEVNCVERMLGNFLDCVEEKSTAELMVVGKLIDGYLGEIAPDSNLKAEKFYKLAVALPRQAREFDDGLYRAVDIYLKAHPWIPDLEREKICGIMDCRKLTLEACTHASQNERLPLRSLVQALFFEQIQLRQAITGNLQHRLSTTQKEEAGSSSSSSCTSRSVVVKENHPRHEVLEHVNGMRSRVHDLEREYSQMRKAIEKIDKVGPRECSHMRKTIEKIDKVGPPTEGWRSSLMKKFGCKYKMQVCDSHESTVKEAIKERIHSHRRHQ